MRFGSPVDFCSPSDQVSYQELDPATGNYSAPITARCDDSTDVEL